MKIISKNKAILFIYMLICQINYNIYTAATIEAVNKVENVDRADLDSQLIEALRGGSELKVRELINSGANVNAVYYDTGISALQLALARGEKIAKLLLEAGAEVNTDQGKAGPLMMAVIYDTGHKDKGRVKLLLKAGADIDAADMFGETALIRAIRLRNSDKELIELLLRAGADLDIFDKKDRRAIDHAKEQLNNIDTDQTKEFKQEIINLLENEPSRRESVVKKWIKEKLTKEINESTSRKLVQDVSKLIAEYSVDYKDIPLEYRLEN